MSYAIIRNEKYKRENLKGIYKHNERKNKNYSNKNIDTTKSHLNYTLKEATMSYDKLFDKLKEEYHLKGQIKTVSNIACEYIITSDKEFFQEIGSEETKRYFKEAYNFVCNYKDLEEKYIMSANVHLDEETPHMHLVFIPVVHTKDKNGNNIDKVACSEFWKGKDSYRQLQDAFYNHMIEHGFKLERGQANNSEHLSIETLKKLTGFNEIDNFLNTDFPEPIEVGNVPDLISCKYAHEQIIEPFKEENLKLIEQNIYLRRNLSMITEQVKLLDDCEKENKKLIKENRKLTKENKRLLKDIDLFDKLLSTLQNTVNKLISWVSSVFKVTEESLIDTFEDETNTFINPVEQLLTEDENLRKELEYEYQK